jgi:3-hydroxyisobutyrate dehydrogenase-like beta-hydroxyacid dehydrogenase
MNDKVTVIGTGRMGSALATALFHKGFATTVWNRTASKTDSLSELGLNVAHSLDEAVRQADIIIVNINNYASTCDLLQHPETETALTGKILVQLSSGTPQEARSMESWAKRSGISYLDGAILGSPNGIGTPACTIFYSGPEEFFKRAEPVLSAFGGNQIFAGNEIGHASAMDIASLTIGVSAMLGFLQGQVVWDGENLPAGGFFETVKGLMPLLEMVFADMSRRIAAKDFTGDQASVEAYVAVMQQLARWCRDRRVDHGLPDAFVNALEQAVKAGKGQSDIACLYETLSESTGKLN